MIKRADIKPSRAIQELLVDDPKDDGAHLAGVLREITSAGIRYPTCTSLAAPQDMREAIEQEAQRLQVRYAACLNRKVGESNASPQLILIDGGKS